MKGPLPPTDPEPVTLPADMLDELLAFGQGMQSALEKGRIERYLELLDGRGVLLDTLFAYRHPSDIAPDWDVRASEFAAQNDALMEAAVAQQQRMQESLNRIEQVKAAHRSYRASAGRTTILDENLRV